MSKPARKKGEGMALKPETPSAGMTVAVGFFLPRRELFFPGFLRSDMAVFPFLTLLVSLCVYISWSTKIAFKVQGR
jgi:hypothetical protein